MARDSVTITALTLNGGVARPTGTTISVANGAVVDPGGDTDSFLLEVRNTNAAEKDVTIKAGVGPTAGLGDLVVPVAADTGVQVICIESARFAQADGTVNIDFEAAMTGTVAAYRLPAGI